MERWLIPQGSSSLKVTVEVDEPSRPGEAAKTGAMDQQFLEDIIRNPNDDGLRLIYADWLSDLAGSLQKEQARAAEDKAEFIRVQVALDAGNEHSQPLTDIRRAELEARQNLLLEQYRLEWKDPLRALGALGATFRRGLPEGVTMSATDFLSNAGELFAIAPIQAVRLVDATAEQIQALGTSLHLANLTSLDLWDNNIGGEGARALAESPHLRKLTSLMLWRNNIGDDGARALAQSLHLKNLTYLDLWDNNIGDDGALALAESSNLIHLTRLTLWHNNIANTGALALAISPHLRNLANLNLGYNVVGGRGALALATSPHLRSLAHLNLWGNAINNAGALLLAESPDLKNLTRLDLDGNHISEAVMREIERSISHRKRNRSENPFSLRNIRCAFVSRAFCYFSGKQRIASN